VIDIVEVLQHWHAERAESVVASSLGMDPQNGPQVHKTSRGGRTEPRWSDPLESRVG
jgi:hypothetical protein